MKEYLVTILPENRQLPVAEGTNLLAALRGQGLEMDSPCGGQGTCGKCRLTVNGKEALACQTWVTGPTTVSLPEKMGRETILTRGIGVAGTLNPLKDGACHLAFDIGTTTVVCYLLDGKTGEELACASMGNPQREFGADVVSRIQHSLQGRQEALTQSIRQGMTELIREVCRRSGISPEQVGVISVVGNPCMQQLFFGLSPENLAAVPFSPVITEAKAIPANKYLSICGDGVLLVIPDISGYVGADTLACLLATEQYARDEMTLLVDIGTNGEMVLGNCQRMVACSTAAGPALEGAKIRFGTRGRTGAIDRVWLEGNSLRCHVIGDVPAEGICGSGLIDAVAVMLESGAMNGRGRILTPEEVPAMARYLSEMEGSRIFRLTEGVYLTQQDIREVQLAKGAIAAGIALMVRHLDLEPEQISRVQLAGAFGSAIRPESAAKIGLIPPELLDRVEAVGNAAGSGAVRLALDARMLDTANRLAKAVEHLELADVEDFQDTFVENMLFE